MNELTVEILYGKCKEIFLWGADYYAERIPDRVAPLDPFGVQYPIIPPGGSNRAYARARTKRLPK